MARKIGLMNTRSLHRNLERIGLPWMTVLLVALLSSLIYLGPSLWQTWTHDGATFVNPAGFVTGHDFVAFYAASNAVLNGEAAMVYERDFMTAAQIAVVGSSDIGYLAFMYPPTFLLVIAPLATLPYLPALALWQALPLVAFLLLLRRIALPPMALIMAAASPAVAQTLFAGQNGLLFALCLGGGLLIVDRRPVLAGVLLGLATAKPQMVILLVPALIAGRQWRALAAMLAIGIGLAMISAALFGPDVWSSYLKVPAEVREFMAAGQLPWSRMPTVYTAARIAGSSDGLALALQFATASLAVAGIAWSWWYDAPRSLRIACVLAGVPLATPFLYDYDLPFMLVAIGIYLADALHRGPALWEKVLMLLVWLQPIWWWWQLVELTGISPAPIVYAAFFVAILHRAKISIASGDGGAGGDPTRKGRRRMASAP